MRMSNWNRTRLHLRALRLELWDIWASYWVARWLGLCVALIVAFYVVCAVPALGSWREPAGWVLVSFVFGYPVVSAIRWFRQVKQVSPGEMDGLLEALDMDELIELAEEREPGS